MDDVIEVEHLCKSYGETVAVADVSFNVARGEIFGLLGRNGAGKTTSVECIQGLRRPDAGELRVLDLDPQRQTHELRRRIGCQLQESALPDRMKVWEALDLFSSLVPGKRDWRRLLDEWGLGDKAKEAFRNPRRPGVRPGRRGRPPAARLGSGGHLGGAVEEHRTRAA